MNALANSLVNIHCIMNQSASETPSGFGVFFKPSARGDLQASLTGNIIIFVYTLSAIHS